MEANELKICERLKDIRINLGMKQGDFAREIKTTQGHVSDIENKRKGVSDRVIEIICLKFNINEEWFRYGKGEIKTALPVQDEYFKAATQIAKSKDKLAMQAIIEYWKLDEESKKAFRNFINNIIDKSRD